MDDEPSTDLPPPKRPWKLWHWPLLFTPSLIMLLMVVSADSLPLLIVYITAPLALFICVVVVLKLDRYSGFKSAAFVIGVWLANIAIVLAACEMWAE